MKYYTATSLGNVEQYRRVRALFGRLGHKLTYDWDSAGPVDWEVKDDDIDTSVVNLSRRSTADLKGVADANAVIVILHEQSTGRGTHVELGAALALMPDFENFDRISRAKRAVFLWAPGGLPKYEKPYPCVFHFDRRLHVVEGDLADLVAAVESWVKLARPDSREPA